MRTNFAFLLVSVGLFLFAQQVASLEAEERGGLFTILDNIVLSCDGNPLEVQNCNWDHFWPCYQIVNTVTKKRDPLLQIFNILADKCTTVTVKRKGQMTKNPASH